MKKNGFTIIELIIIIGLLMVVVGIFSVNFIRTMNKQKITATQNMISQIVSAADAYVSMYPDTIKALYDGSDYVDISIGTLRDKGFLNEKIVDVETGENISDDDFVRVKVNDKGVLDFKYPPISSSGGSTSNPSDTYYTLTFMNEGAKYSERQVKTGETASGFPSPIKSGYTFDGWYTSSSGGEKKTSIAMDGNKTLYARWIKKEDSLIEKIKNTARTDCSTINFANPATTDEGICTLEDDYGTSYYYRGAVTNNYVKFGTWNEDIYVGENINNKIYSKTFKSLKECQSDTRFNYNCRKHVSIGDDMYWRIIRVNGDGSVRILYDGTSAHANGTDTANKFTHMSQKYNTKYNDVKYVGWMYGPSGTTTSTSREQAQTNTADSDIKKVVDEWYKTNIVDNGFSGAIVDKIFCNDRSILGKEKSGFSDDTGLGYGKNWTAYGAYARLGVESVNYNNVHPTFVCPQKNDAFTVSDTEKGNGALTYPVGLITADEIVAAGGKYNTFNSTYYLYNPNKNASIWSLTPSHAGSYAYVFNLYNTYGLRPVSVEVSDAVSPVINLNAEYFNTLIGTGTMSDPYRAS